MNNQQRVKHTRRTCDGADRSTSDHKVEHHMGVIKRTIYHPPEAEQLEELAWRLRQQLGEDSDFEDGVGGFLKALAKAYARTLSRGHEPLDRGIE